MTKKQFTERSVYGGFSEDDKLKGAAQILYAENLDLTTNSDYYTVSQKASIEQVTSAEVDYIFEASSQVFFCDNDRNLYRLGTSIPVWTAERIISSWVTSTYLYLFDTSEDIHRILLTDLGQADWTTFITTTDTSIPADSGDVYIVADEDKTYLSIGNHVYEINNSVGTVVGANTFTITSDVVGLSITESNLQIFTEDGKYIIRDGVAGGVVRIKDLGVKIGVVKNIGSDNYIFSGGAMYILNGYKLEQILSDTYSDVLDGPKYSLTGLTNTSITFLEGMFYIGVNDGPPSLETPGNEFEFGNDGILTYGVKKQGFPAARNMFISNINGVNIKDVTSLYTKVQANSSIGKVLLIGYEDVNGNFGLAEISLGDQSSKGQSKSGIMVYNIFDGGLKEAQKSLLRVKIRADLTYEDDVLYLCTLNKDGSLEWFNGTQEKSSVTLSSLGDDGYYYFEPVGDRQFYNFTPALILENNGPSTDFRRNRIKVYSLTYEYDTTRQN